MTASDLLLAGLAAVAAGAVNALAGGGTLISFPVLIALGVPPLAANITNAVALCPGYFGATLAQVRNLEGQSRRASMLIPISAVGGIAGAIILVQTGERTFEALVPWMLMTASVLLAIQEPVRAMVLRRSDERPRPESTSVVTMSAVLAASIYGGFFTAGMSVLIVAVLGLTSSDTFTRLNALKQMLAFTVNVAAVLFFVSSEHVIWSATAVMALGALVGGALGGKLAAKINPSVLRWGVVAAGASIAIVYWIKDA
jgi:uncharacterized membrane protein YfcA